MNKFKYKSTDWLNWPTQGERIQVHGDGWFGYPYTEDTRTFVLHRPDLLVLFQNLEKQRARYFKGEVSLAFIQALYISLILFSYEHSMKSPKQRFDKWFLRKLFDEAVEAYAVQFPNP